MFCDQCGTAASPGAQFCRHCGAALDVSITVGEKGPAAPASTATHSAWTAPPPLAPTAASVEAGPIMPAALAGLLGGAVGALVGGLVIEVVYPPTDFDRGSFFGTSVWLSPLREAVAGPILGAFIGCALGAVMALARRDAQHALVTAGVVAAVGAMAGLVSDYILYRWWYDVVFTALDSLPDRVSSSLWNAVTGAIFGGLVALGLVLVDRRRRGARRRRRRQQRVNGLAILGGIFGGAVGGALSVQVIWDSYFDSVAIRVGAGVVYGAAVGAGIGLLSAVPRTPTPRAGYAAPLGGIVAPATVTVAPGVVAPSVPPDPVAWYGDAYRQALPPVRSDTNGMAVASLILGLLGIWLLALVFGYMATGQIRRSGGYQRGRGMAIAGIVLGWIGCVVAVVFVLMLARLS